MKIINPKEHNIVGGMMSPQAHEEVKRLISKHKER